MFVAVVEARGFTAAARVTGLRKALLSRRIQELEARLGARLLERTTRTVRVTEVGQAFYERAVQAVSIGRQAIASVAEAREEPWGTLRISTTPLLADHLAPIIVAYLGRYWNIAVELDVGVHTVDVVGDRFDLALRVGAPPPSSLRVRRLGRGRSVYVASPSYLARMGTPATPADMERQRAIVITGGPLTWSFVARGRSLTITPTVSLKTPSFDIAREAVRAGIGVARLPSFFVQQALDAGELTTVVDEWTPPEVPIVALFGPGKLPTKTRRFLDMLTEYFEEHPLEGLLHRGRRGKVLR